MLTSKSLSDFDNSKKAEFYDEDGFEVADEQNKDKLKTPKTINNIAQENQ